MPSGLTSSSIHFPSLPRVLGLDHRVDLGGEGDLVIERVGITGFDHCQARAPFLHQLDDDRVDLRHAVDRAAFPERLGHPVVREGLQDDLLSGRPVVEHVRAGAVLIAVEQRPGDLRQVPVAPGGAVIVPVALLDHPLLVHDPGPGLDEQLREVGGRVGQLDRHDAGGIVRNHGVADGFADRHIIAADDVERPAVTLSANPGGLQHRVEEQAHRTAGAQEVPAEQHVAVEGVGDVMRLERAALVELDALTDVEGVGQAVVRDAPLVGQHRHELIDRRALQEQEPVVQVPGDVDAG